jgi:hypothetical protein
VGSSGLRPPSLLHSVLPGLREQGAVSSSVQATPMAGWRWHRGPDLQTWIRNDDLQPVLLRVGTDILGGAPAPTSNGAFALNGQTVSEPGSVYLLGFGALGLLGAFFVRRGTARAHDLSPRSYRA